MAFDPDVYLASKSSGFDPDAYLEQKGKGSKMGLPQKIAQAATLPFRGYRGVAVGLENLPKGPSAALMRAAEAVRPGFQPQGAGETIAAMLGESAPLAPLGGALGAGGRLAQLAKTGALGSGLSALTQTAEEGKPTLGRTATAGALTATPVAAMQGLKAVFPYVAGGFTKTVPAAYQGLTTAFKQRFPGTQQAIESASGRVTPVLKKAYAEVNRRLEGSKKYQGMTMTPQEALVEAEATGGDPRTISRIVKEFRGIQGRSAPISEKTVPSQLLGPTGKPLTRKVVERGISKGEKLRRLSDMAIDINKQTEGSYTTDVLQTKKAIEREAMKTGGASYKIFNKFKQQWGKIKDIEERLGSNLSDPNASGAKIEQLVRRQIEKKLSPTDQAQLEAVKDLEKITGRQIIEPLRNQIISSYTNRPLSEFVPRGMLGKLLLMKFPLEGLASFSLGSPKVMGRAAQALYNPAGPITKAAKPMTAELINRVLNKFRGSEVRQ